MALVCKCTKEYAFFGFSLLKAREEAGLTQQELSDKFQINEQRVWTQQRISQIEIQIPPEKITQEQFDKLSQILETQII